MNAPDLSWRITVHDRLEQTVGAGVLVSPQTVLTCAHVVDDRGLNLAPSETVLLGFPGLPRRALAQGTVSRVHKELDFAVLSLDQPVPEAAPAVIKPAGPAGGRPVRMFSQPRGLPEGVWTRARLLGSSGPRGRWVQLESVDDPAWTTNRPGISGAGVMDADGTVIGIVVAADRRTSASWMLPTEAIADEVPEIATRLGQARPHTSGAPRGATPVSRLAGLVDALVHLNEFADPGSRELVIELLPPPISGQIPRHSNARQDALAVLQTCMSYPNGLHELVEVLHQVAGDSPALHRFEQAVAQAES